MTALARRAVACKGWRWLPGAQDVDARTVVDLCHDNDPVWYDGETVTADDPGAEPLPDLDDPATLGCLLALVREAYDCPSLRAGHEGGWDDGWDKWGVGNPAGRGHGCRIVSRDCATEAEALVAALEAAPQKDEQCAL